MTKAIPVDPVSLAGKTWLRSPNYLFAADKTICPIDFTEVPKAAVNMPLAFVKSGEKYHLTAVLGLLHNQNLYVDNNGRWLADYVPLEYRLHPFLLAQADEERSVLCIDEESGLLSDSSSSVEGQLFFDGDEPTDLIKNIMNTLITRHTQRLQTQQIVQQLADHNLLKAWNLEFKINNEDKQLEGLYCIDEGVIAELTAEQLLDLRSSGALPLIYCQMLSMHQIQYLLKLLKNRLPAQTRLMPTSGAELSIDGLGSDSGTLSFDNL